MRVSVIVTTYNRPAALRAVLQALAEQRADELEILVADDGSGESTRAVVQEHAGSRFPLRHLWQEDRGFRAGAARNRAAAAATGAYLLFLDGDCVPRPDWITQHRRLAEPGWMVAGNRVLLSAALTERVLASGAPLQRWTLSRWSGEARGGGINRLMPLLYLPLGPLRRIGATRWQRVRTCNLGVFRRDFAAVNGFDELYEGWGFEDSDLAVRLLHLGIRRKLGTGATAVLHLWHPENDRRNEPANLARLQQRIAGREVRAAAGYDAYPAAPG
jgi:glycosyltransferase involved in cell wall biosynthesis